MNLDRRAFIGRAAGAGLAAAAPAALTLNAWAQAPSTPAHRFAPQPGDWRSFDLTTRLDLPAATSATRAWVPLPSVQADWQWPLGDSFSSNGQARLVADGVQGVRLVAVDFAPGTAQPFVEVTSRVRTQSRALATGQRPVREDASTLRAALQPTRLLPTDGIVRDTARRATRGARSDEAKVRALYDWVVSNAWREPTVKGCGEGDIKTMLETGNLGGKCADLNALFVGLCRAAGVPARDVYGIRLAPSAFGYQQLGSGSANLTGAQHCRAEVYLQARGWTAMDPADVAKVMRQERPEWIKRTDDPLIAPAHQGLYGAWEGNWMAYNTAHDVKLPGSRGEALGFVMYPMAENADGWFDQYDPATFKYRLSARQLAA
jgi:transglutaminase-like putative cysteine protease